MPLAPATRPPEAIRCATPSSASRSPSHLLIAGLPLWRTAPGQPSARCAPPPPLCQASPYPPTHRPGTGWVWASRWAACGPLRRAGSGRVARGCLTISSFSTWASRAWGNTRFISSRNSPCISRLGMSTYCHAPLRDIAQVLAGVPFISPHTGLVEPPTATGCPQSRRRLPPSPGGRTRRARPRWGE